MANEDFGLPPEVAPIPETSEQREARIRAKAAAAVAAEYEAAMLVRFMAEERAKIAPPGPDAQGFPPDYDRILVSIGNQKTDLTYVPLSLNGYCIKVPRGEEVIIPHCFVEECLEHAIEEVSVQTQGGYITRPAPRFQYSFKGKATKEEYLAYLETQKAKALRETLQAA